MDKHSLETIELEMAIFLRHITSMTTYIGTLDRSAYLLLHQITSHGSAGVKALADEFHLDISTVSRQAAALEQKGLVTKKQDPSDGRAYTFRITELGMKELEKTKQARTARFADLLNDWSDEEQQIFGRLLNRFNQTINKR